MFRSMLTGLRRAGTNPQMILWLLAANFAAALPAAVPMLLTVLATVAQRTAARRMFADRLDYEWLIDLANGRLAGFSLAALTDYIIVLAALMGALYGLLNLFLSGGVLAVFAAEGGRFTPARFWAGCGAYFGRFVTLALLALPCYGAAVVGYFIGWNVIGIAVAKATTAGPMQIAKLALLFVFVLVCALINAIFDYAKIAVVRHDGRALSAEVGRAAEFTLRRFGSAFGLYLTAAAIGLLGFGALAWLRGLIVQSSLPAVAAAFVVGQTALGWRLGARAAFYAAAVDLHRRLVLAPAPAAEKLPLHETAPQAEFPEALPEIQPN